LSKTKPAARRAPLIVNGYRVEPSGDGDDMWFLTRGEDRAIAGTMIRLRDGSWRCRAPAGGVRDVAVPEGVADPVAYVAGQVTAT